jgi:hypothetical protein
MDVADLGAIMLLTMRLTDTDSSLRSRLLEDAGSNAGPDDEGA